MKKVIIILGIWLDETDAELIAASVPPQPETVDEMLDRITDFDLM